MKVLKEVVACAVNGLAAGFDTKEEARESILAYIHENYKLASSHCLPEAREPEELPVSVLNMLNQSLGISFPVHNGKITGGGV